MIRKHIVGRILTLLASAAVVTATATTQGAMTFTVALDDGTQSTTASSNTVFTADLGPMYTTHGSPIVTNIGNSTTLNFNADLSTNFHSQVTNIFTVSQSTDGHLVLDLHFDTPVSITASIFEGGTWSTTGNGTVAANGGQLDLEAVDPTPVEIHSAGFTTDFVDQPGGWTATSTTAPFNGLYTDYQLLIDNILVAGATNGTADITKKAFTITINSNPGAGAPPSPEPASLGILGLGAVGLFIRRRR